MNKTDQTKIKSGDVSTGIALYHFQLQRVLLEVALESLERIADVKTR